MKAVLLCIAIVAGLTSTFSNVARADDVSSCQDTTGLYGTHVVCHYTHSSLLDAVHVNAGSVRYRVTIACLSDAQEGLCNNPRTCADPPGSVLYNVFASTNGGAFVFSGDVCLLSGQDGDFGGGQITLEMVETAFQDLAWPVSPLSIQPPNGRTLVNLATNFLTTNTQASSQQVTLLGHDVEIEATPTTWTWHFGDDTDDTTSTPGAAYPDLEITHTYTDADVTLHPSVDTGYHGRYRVDGGAWNDIPVERTIAGTAVDLQVLEARPVLVAPSD